MKIGIYGGTFNPIHKAHVYIINEFVKRIGLDKVIIMPTAVPPHKAAKELTDSRHRLEMCRLALRDIESESAEVSDLEITRGGLSYSSDTLTEIKKQRPEDDLYFLMGEDMFLTVERWHEAATIFKLAVLCASPRSGDGFERLLKHREYLAEKYGAKALVFDIPYIHVSSTEIRERLENKESIKGLVPEAVGKYIDDHGLYMNCTEPYQAGKDSEKVDKG